MPEKTAVIPSNSLNLLQSTKHRYMLRDSITAMVANRSKMFNPSISPHDDPTRRSPTCSGNTIFVWAFQRAAQ